MVAGHTGTATLTVESLSGFTGTLVVNCSGLPAHTACSVSPNGFTINPGSPQTLTLQILTDIPPVTPPPPVGWLRIPGTNLPVLAVLLLAPLGLYSRRRKITRLLTVVLLLFAGLGAVSLTGCEAAL